MYRSYDERSWDSVDLDEARHPQTLIAWGMNGGDLPVPFGGPLRMRVPRQLGYKSVKYINRLIVTDSLKDFGKGSADAEDGYALVRGDLRRGTSPRPGRTKIRAAVERGTGCSEMMGAR